MRFILVCLIVFPSICFAQTTHTRSAPTSLEPSPYIEEVYGAQIAKKKSQRKSPTIETREEFEARMQRTAKAIRKREKLMQKPQYSDPRYFGHKRLPKKRKPGKMKFCSECEIRH